MYFAAIKLVFYLNDMDRVMVGKSVTAGGRREAHKHMAPPKQSQSPPRILWRITRYRFLLDSVDATIAFAHRVISSRIATMAQKSQHQQQRHHDDLRNDDKNNKSHPKSGKGDGDDDTHDDGGCLLKREWTLWLGWKSLQDVLLRFRLLDALQPLIYQRLVAVVAQAEWNHPCTDNQVHQRGIN